MKANEIQIGDWVHNETLLFGVPYGEDIQVRNIYKDLINYVDSSESGLIVGYRLNECKPIPLTAEILWKNGFVKVNSQRYEYGHPNTDCYVKVNPKKTMMHINGRNANSNLYLHFFVHELQHALRLCGLTELADNFKI